MIIERTAPVPLHYRGGNTETVLVQTIEGTLPGVILHQIGSVSKAFQLVGDREYHETTIGRTETESGLLVHGNGAD